ncbi:PadR family transcriptional regulator [Deinococcus roseus]|uniref:PadR family transcriptional regulator n=1 Tax=Deinococcus roseus TaxID=392414 RepID=A0ABQ2CZQ2_9DEIO|nr:PadR family transcriptional regulator [Deinococcus roseus]GGJ36962.1 PadR family transcriptional regulator [Deinococcus roseus]
MPQKRKVSNLLALAVLSYLSRQPMHPYELSRTLKQHQDDRSIKFNPGSLYMVVEQLHKAGFVQELGTDRAGNRPERTTYQISDSGRTELYSWLKEIIETPQPEYPQFMTALALIAALPPAEVLDLLGKRLIHLQEQHQQTVQYRTQTLQSGVHPLFLIEEDYRLVLLEAEIQFVRQFIPQVREWQHPWEQLQSENREKP